MGKKKFVPYFDLSACKITLTTAKARLAFSKEKVTNDNYTKLQDVIKLLKAGKVDLAFIKTQNIMIKNYQIKGMAALENHIEFLKEELPALSRSPEILATTLPHICAIMWTAKNTSICVELVKVVQHLAGKFGPEKMAELEKMVYPPEKFKSYFTIEQFSDKFVWEYLIKIAEGHGCPVPKLPASAEDNMSIGLPGGIPGGIPGSIPMGGMPMGGMPMGGMPMGGMPMGGMPMGGVPGGIPGGIPGGMPMGGMPMGGMPMGGMPGGVPGLSSDDAVLQSLQALSDMDKYDK
ncbi:Vacuolar protein sorting-associated protein Ist1 like protein [Aduncisulcus paluster]|uniref:Vacuolar protein sorting-associated protein Ist1 like protein n=1 Tax=Aduncisulcus paluster TaxID=2918883 RepID=A0ABQ5K5I2_9EUKA|nr:Vacuolar protein sorting-associated protein Ist1 like protein [Aduncisulcus paluster]